jgi:hypothetical protein
MQSGSHLDRFSRSYACFISACKALTVASRLSIGTNRLTECGDNTYLSAAIPCCIAIERERGGCQS